MSRAVAIGLASAWLVAVATPARAETRTRLSVTDDACNGTTLRAGVAALVGRDGFVSDDDQADVDLTVHVVITTAAGAVIGTIEVEADGVVAGERTIAAVDCTALADAASLAIAMVMAQPRGESAEPAAPVSPAPPDPTEIPPITLETAGPPPRRIAGLEMMGGVAGGRAGGGFQGQVVVGAAVRRGRASIELDFAIAAPDRVTVGPGRVVVTTRTFELAACVHRGSLAGCATAAAGWIRGRGEDLIDPSMATNPYVAPGVRGQWNLDLSDRLAVRVQLAARVPLTRNRFLVDNMAVWSTSPIEAWLGFGLVAQIP